MRRWWRGLNRLQDQENLNLNVTRTFSKSQILNFRNFDAFAFEPPRRVYECLIRVHLTTTHAGNTMNPSESPTNTNTHVGTPSSHLGLPTGMTSIHATMVFDAMAAPPAAHVERNTLSSRQGTVLARGTILKTDHFYTGRS